MVPLNPLDNGAQVAIKVPHAGLEQPEKVDVTERDWAIEQSTHHRVLVFFGLAAIPAIIFGLLMLVASHQ